MERSTPRVYVLNSPVLTAYGAFTFEGPVEAEDARAMLAGGFTSAVGHAGTAELISAVLGVEIPVSRSQIVMEAGDTALVLRLKGRLPQGQVLDADELRAVPREFGRLTRTA